MNNRIKSLGVVIFLIASSCKTVSRYAIDEHIIIKTDTSFFGIWKIKEDTDKANYILVQSPNDLAEDLRAVENQDSAQRRSQYSKEFLANPNNARLVYLKDTALDNIYYKEFEKEEGYYYHLEYFNRHGINPIYGATASHSEISGEQFLNVSYYKGYDMDENEINRGYFFIHLISRDISKNTLTIAVVADTTLGALNNSKEVRKRIKKNLYNPSFYMDTLHLYKVSDYHLNQMKSVEKAN